MSLSIQPGSKTLQTLLAPIVRWSVRLGLGYGQFTQLLKPVFFQAAMQEIQSKGLKVTDSALSLASGLHKGDIELFKNGTAPPTLPNPKAMLADEELAAQVDRINPATQVVARWVATGLPRVLPLRGDGDSFASLVRQSQLNSGTSALSPRLLLQDLQRRGVVSRSADGQQVELISEVGLPNVDDQESIVHFVGAVRDHMEACLNNLDAHSGHKFLEQCLSADGLYPDSVETIHAMARVWWVQAMRTVGTEAITLSERDEPQGGRQRLRFGVYFYTQEAPAPEHPSQPVHSK